METISIMISSKLAKPNSKVTAAVSCSSGLLFTRCKPAHRLPAAGWGAAAPDCGSAAEPWLASWTKTALRTHLLPLEIASNPQLGLWCTVFSKYT